MKGRIFSFFTTILVLIIGMCSFADFSFANTPSFPSCNNPQGQVVASYDSGIHGIVGDASQHTGSDIVYSVNSDQTLQCFCSGGGGIQTNWWKVPDLSEDEVTSLQNQGWTYVPTGEAWGLANAPYFAQNSAYTCGGGNNQSNDGQNNGSSSSNGGGSSAPTCNDTAPAGAPTITAITSGTNSVTLTWTKAQDPVSYYLIAYGTQPGKYDFGNPNVGGPDTTSYTIHGLSGSTTYYFVVRAGNGCKPGPFSGEVSSDPSGGAMSSPADGFVPNVLASTATSSAQVDGSSAIAQICKSCLWWPILLGEIAILLLYYLLVRRKKLRLNRLLVGGIIAVIAYIVFLILNRGHVCPLGGINLYFLSIPCKYFWAIDGAVYLLLSWFTRKNSSFASWKK